MRNIYQEDFSSEDKQEQTASRKDSASASKPVRPARQAPPPIQKRVIAQKQTPAPTENAPAAPYGQPAFYPQPVFYQPDANGHPVPVFYAPQPYIPVQYQQSAAPVESAPVEGAPVESGPNEAGTRVLFQSDDFDKKEELTESYSDFTANNIPASIDLSEINLSSGKRAPAPKKTAPVDFKVDDMEIGTYEFNIMTAGQTSKAKSVLTPDEEFQQAHILEESYIDEIYEYEDESGFEEEDVEEPKAIFTIPDIKLPSKEIIRRSVLAISAVAILIACITLINEYRLHRQNKQLMNDISEMIITEPTTFADTDSGKKPQSDVPTTLPLQERPLSVEEQWEAIKSENPDVVFPEGIQLKYAKLYAQNPDFVGYLYAEGSELDTPIVQGETDEEYVERNFNGEYTKYACPFVTSTNQIRELDGNTVIYGHHMRDGSIFGKLDQYRTIEGYKEAPVINFNTLYNDYSFKVIAAFITNINPKDDNDYVFTYYWTNLNNELNYTAYLNQLSQRSLYDTGVDVQPTDKLLTLSTCCKDFEDARFVVVARLVRPGESTEVDTSKAVENTNPRFPQAYYTAKGKKNPFAEAYKWEIS